MDLLKSIKAAGNNSAYLPAIAVNSGASPTIGADMATGINPFGITGTRFELFPMENPYLMREGYKNNHIVFTIADWKAQRLSEATPILYRIKSKKYYNRYLAYAKNNQYFEARYMRTKALDEVEDINHPILKLLANPNERQTWSEFAYAWSIFYDFGNAMIWKKVLSAGANKGQARKLYLLPPHIYEGINPTVAGYEVYQQTANSQIRLSGSDVMHCARFDPEQGYMWGTMFGMSKLAPARRLLAKSNASMEAQAEMFNNRGGRWILFPKASQFNENTDVSVDNTSKKQAFDALRKKMSQAGAGGIAGNAFELDGIDLSMSMVDLDVLNSDKISKDEWCALWHVQSLAIFSATEGTFANADAAIKASLNGGVLPDQRLLGQKLTSWITPDYGDGYVIGFDTDVYPELQANKTEMAAWCDKAGLNLNERRRMFGYDEIDEPYMNVPLYLTNLAPATDLLALPAEPAADPTKPVPDKAAPADETAKNDGTYTD